MKSINWAMALSLTVGVTGLAGCGQSPTAPTSKAPAATGAAAAAQTSYTGGMAAQEGVTTPAATSAPMVPVPAPATGGGSAAAPTGGTTTAPAAPQGPTAAVPPASSGVLGDARVGGIGGGVSKALDRGLGAFDFGANALVAFQSDRRTGGGCQSDIFVYDALAQTVLALPAVNTGANETNPRLSSNGLWLVYQTDESGTEDIRVFDLRSQLIDTLRTLNTENWDEQQPDISDDGNLIVYVTNEPGGGISGHGRFDGGRDGKDGKDGRSYHVASMSSDGKDGKDGWDNKDGKDGGSMRHHDHGRLSGDNLRLYNTHNGANFIVPAANRGLSDISWPSISGNGAVIAYGGATRCGDPREIYVYSVTDAAQLTPPFLNVANADQGNPDLNELGDRIAFMSNRRGSDDIYMTDLRSGFTDNMVLANSAAKEQNPRFLGPVGDRVVFQTDRACDFRIMVFDFPTGLLDTLPVANEVGSDTQLRTEHPAL